MCKAFSCVVRKDRKVFWKVGTDGHEDLITFFKLKDGGDIVRVEVNSC